MPDQWLSPKELVRRSVAQARDMRRRGDTALAAHAMNLARHIKRASLRFGTYY